MSIIGLWHQVKSKKWWLKYYFICLGLVDSCNHVYARQFFSKVSRRLLPNLESNISLILPTAKQKERPRISKLPKRCYSTDFSSWVVALGSASQRKRRSLCNFHYLACNYMFTVKSLNKKNKKKKTSLNLIHRLLIKYNVMNHMKQ